MSEHYTAGTIEVTHWCNVCRRPTQHRVDPRDVTATVHGGHVRVAGILGPCLEHGPKVNAQGESKRQETARKKRDREAANPPLFEEPT
ncbi:MAG TPA: hypothetical protein VN943_00495 [Candidatus Acidoferrum sp.]|nr:hypothetical protein [Candidatus Acidoferrum sp.]